MKKNRIIVVLIILICICISPVSAMQVVKCGGFSNVPAKPLIVVGKTIKIIQILVPIIIIVMGIVDFVKALISTDDAKKSAGIKMFVKRVLYGLVVFFVIAIVQFIFAILEDGTDYMSCASCIVGNDCETKTIQIGESTGREDDDEDFTGINGSTEGSTVDEIEAIQEKKKVTGIEITKKKTSMKVGETYTVKASVKPKNATNKKIIYKSSKTGVATINVSGKITAKKKGTTTITVQSSDNKSKKKSFKLTVTKNETTTLLTTTSSTGGFTYYNQGDYSGVGFCGGGKTLQSSGCGAVSFSIIASNLVNKSYNPNTVAKWLCANGHSGGALAESWFTKKNFLNKFGLQSKKLAGELGTNSSKISAIKNKILKELKNNKMVILYIPGHYVVLAKGENNKVVLMDPGKRANNGTYTIDKIYEMTKNYKNRCTSSNNCGWHGVYSFSKK